MLDDPQWRRYHTEGFFIIIIIILDNDLLPKNELEGAMDGRASRVDGNAFAVYTK